MSIKVVLLSYILAVESIKTPPFVFFKIVSPSIFWTSPLTVIPLEPMFLRLISPSAKFLITLPAPAFIPPLGAYELIETEPWSFLIAEPFLTLVLTKELNNTSA